MAHSQFSDLWLTTCFFSDRRLGKIHLRGSEQRRVWAEEGEELCRLLRWALNMLPGLFSVFDQDVIFLFILGLDCFVTRADKSPKSWIYSLQWTPQNINVMTSSVIIFWWVRCLYKNSTMFVRSDVVLTFLHTHRRKWSWSITSSCLTLLRHDVIIRLIRIVWTGWHDQRSAVNTTKTLRIISWHLLSECWQKSLRIRR